MLGRRALCYYNEGWGCTENQDKARRLLREAADQGEPNAKKILGL